MDLKEEDFLKEAFKIIDSNKTKASTLRNTILNLNQNIYNNNLNLQIIQFLGEFEYDLKTLIELLNDFKKKSKIHFQNKLNAIKTELNIIKTENISLKELKDNKFKNKKNNNNKNKNSLNIRNTLDNKIYNQNKNKNKTIQKSENFEKSNNMEKSLNKKENLSQNYFYTNKAKIIKNKNNKENIKNFCDYNSFLTNLKRHNSKSNFNFIKYENYKQNNKKDRNINEIARGKINNSVRAQSANSKIIFKNSKNLDEEKKQKIINEIFQDETILNALKNQFGNEIEDKLLNGDINTEFLLKIEEISDKMKKNYQNINNNKNSKDLELKNKNLNLKIPKRYSNYKCNNPIDNLIITS